MLCCHITFVAYLHHGRQETGGMDVTPSLLLKEAPGIGRGKNVSKIYQILCLHLAVGEASRGCSAL